MKWCSFSLSFDSKEIFVIEVCRPRVCQITCTIHFLGESRDRRENCKENVLQFKASKNNEKRKEGKNFNRIARFKSGSEEKLNRYWMGLEDRLCGLCHEEEQVIQNMATIRQEWRVILKAMERLLKSKEGDDWKKEVLERRHRSKWTSFLFYKANKYMVMTWNW